MAGVETQSSQAAIAGAPRRSARAWLAWSAGWTLAAAGLFAACLRQAQTWKPDADAAAIALQAQEMLHGNLLLHGWWLADVTFYTTELPEYMLVGAAHTDTRPALTPWAAPTSMYSGSSVV